jgi:hypothetical protein
MGTLQVDVRGPIRVEVATRLSEGCSRQDVSRLQHRQDVPCLRSLDHEEGH